MVSVGEWRFVLLDGKVLPVRLAHAEIEKEWNCPGYVRGYRAHLKPGDGPGFATWGATPGKALIDAVGFLRTHYGELAIELVPPGEKTKAEAVLAERKRCAWLCDAWADLRKGIGDDGWIGTHLARLIRDTQTEGEQ